MVSHGILLEGRPALILALLSQSINVISIQSNISNGHPPKTERHLISLPCKLVLDIHNESVYYSRVITEDVTMNDETITALAILAMLLITMFVYYKEVVL